MDSWGKLFYKAIELADSKHDPEEMAEWTSKKLYDFIEENKEANGEVDNNEN
jgi:hypothetical protein